jgi:Histidine kinase-, DNA gyrase B-, and HSP90-like ATPase
MVMVQKKSKIGMGKKNHELIPSARRLIASLRDMGYDFPAAVADVVDNSIEAGATRVNIDVRGDIDDSWVRISDNGSGMESAEIREALRYGATRDHDQRKALGKFGLGLKTASMSQCRHLLVASRSNRRQAQISAYTWDLDHVEKTDSWEILTVGPKEHPELLREPLLTHTGTVVLWRKLDRMLGFKHPYGGMVKRRLAIMCAELEEHLAMAFHRYIAGEAGGKKVRISVNGKRVEAWDPFARSEKATVRLEPVQMHYDHDGVRGVVTIEPYVLPHQHEFSSAAAHAAAAGPERWNRQQGFYIYRADRMVQSGGWSSIRTLDEHVKLARVAVSFEPRLDEAFRVNVAKMRVQLPRQLREQMELAIAPVIKLAQAAYRREFAASPEAVARREPPSNLTRAEGGISLRRQTGSLELNEGSPHERRWTLQDVMFELERVASREERAVLRRVMERMLQTLPESKATARENGKVHPLDTSAPPRPERSMNGSARGA